MIIRCIDFETTGFPPKAGVCEAGWTDVVVMDDGAAVGPTFSYLCNPGMPIGEKASAVNGITDAMVAGEPSSANIFQIMAEGADMFCAHNIEFERAFFGGGERDWLCTYKVALALFPDLPNHKNGDIPTHLQLCLDRMRCEPLHRAGPDSYVTAVILAFMIMKDATALGDTRKAVREFVAISKRPKQISRMPFGKDKGVEISQLPKDYLEWCADKMTAADIRHACAQELNRRRKG